MTTDHEGAVAEVLTDALGGQLPGPRGGRRIARPLRSLLERLDPASDGLDRSLRRDLDIATRILDPTRHGVASERTRPVEPRPRRPRPPSPEATTLRPEQAEPEPRPWRGDRLR